MVQIVLKKTIEEFELIEQEKNSVLESEILLQKVKNNVMRIKAYFRALNCTMEYLQENNIYPDTCLELTSENENALNLWNMRFNTETASEKQINLKQEP
jgi:hypothetical protein